MNPLFEEFAEVEPKLSDPAVIADQRAYAEVGRRYKELEPIVALGRIYEERMSDIEIATEMLADASGEDRATLEAEVADAEAAIEELSEELKVLLRPRDPNDGKNVMLEIRGAEGGEEANLFARDLYDMYNAYAVRAGFKTELLEARETAHGGFSEVTFMVKGREAWRLLRHEAGTHRVQRVPVTESQGRVHTSSATVSVLPEAEEVEVDIDPNDLQIDVYRASGPGGQSVNTTDSAVRITHKPSGVVVSMQDEKSQLQNRAKAMRVLRARILQAEQDRQAAELSGLRRDQIGSGGRSEKIRTYNFKENRVSDHRIGLTIYKLEKVLEGELEEVLEGLESHVHEGGVLQS